MILLGLLWGMGAGVAIAVAKRHRAQAAERLADAQCKAHVYALLSQSTLPYAATPLELAQRSTYDTLEIKRALQDLLLTGAVLVDAQGRFHVPIGCCAGERVRALEAAREQHAAELIPSNAWEPAERDG